MTCVRAAWLTMDGTTVRLHDEAAGYFVTSLDLGSPDIREVTNNRPDMDGTDDRTRLMGGRVVSVNVSAVAGVCPSIDKVAASFAPFMVPRARPTLHYVLDRPGAPERTLMLRAAAYSFKVDNEYQRDIQLQWRAADPVARDPAVQSAFAWAGSGAVGAGRTYDLAFNRTYPAGGGAPTQGIIHSNGDVAVQPLLRIFGPVTQPRVTFTTPDGRTFRVWFLNTFVVGAGAWVDVDTHQHTAWYNGDPTQNMLGRLDWPNTTWPVLPVGGDNHMTLTGQNTNQITQAVATWQDGFLT